MLCSRFGIGRRHGAPPAVRCPFLTGCNVPAQFFEALGSPSAQVKFAIFWLHVNK
jgi:hypothetical protein